MMAEEQTLLADRLADTESDTNWVRRLVLAGAVAVTGAGYGQQLCRLFLEFVSLGLLPPYGLLATFYGPQRALHVHSNARPFGYSEGK